MFLGFEDTWECTVPKVTKYIEVRDVQKLFYLTYVEQSNEGEEYHPPPPPKNCFSDCAYEPWPAKYFRCWRKNVDKCQEAFHSQRTIGAKPVKSSAQLLQSSPWLPYSVTTSSHRIIWTLFRSNKIVCQLFPNTLPENTDFLQALVPFTGSLTLLSDSGS